MSPEEKARQVIGNTKLRDLIQQFRNSYFPRIAITVDMNATGTDVTASRASASFKCGATPQSPAESRDNPLECVFFMRSVKSLSFFEHERVRRPRDFRHGTERTLNEIEILELKL